MRLFSALPAVFPACSPFDNSRYRPVYLLLTPVFWPRRPDRPYFVPVRQDHPATAVPGHPGMISGLAAVFHPANHPKPSPMTNPVPSHPATPSPVRPTPAGAAPRFHLLPALLLGLCLLAVPARAQHYSWTQKMNNTVQRSVVAATPGDGRSYVLTAFTGFISAGQYNFTSLGSRDLLTPRAGRWPRCLREPSGPASLASGLSTAAPSRRASGELLHSPPADRSPGAPPAARAQ